MSQSTEIGISRRNALRGAVALSGLAVLSCSVESIAALTKPGALRFAHMTDMHLKPEAQHGEGYAMALRSLAKLDPQPQFIITGGDHVMETLASTKQRAIVQWDLYDKVLAESTKLKTYPLIGNHDVWAWSAKVPVPEETPGYGKALALDRLHLAKGYYAFDAGGWRFIILDNVAHKPGGYYGNLDAEQTEWFKGELSAAGTTKPVIVISHIPIFGACPLLFAYGDGGPKTFWHVGDNLLHHDAKSVMNLFKGHNVPLAVSGHIHLLERLKYLDVTYICDGSICGDWWGGPFQEIAEGYGVFDLWPDGTFEHQYITYGWKAPQRS
jgi:Icc protein